MSTNQKFDNGLQLDPNKLRVWVHSGKDGSTLGRFDVRSGMDIHNSVTDQIAGKSQCLKCTHEKPDLDTWNEFRRFSVENWGIFIAQESIDTKRLKKHR